jgi:DnaJ-class molecular chaperone
MAKCKRCKGAKRVTVAWLGMCGYVDVEEPCPHCKGTGIEPKDKKEG